MSDAKILDILKDERIFSATRILGGVVLREECDEFFGRALSTAQVKKLAAELLALADEPEPVDWDVDKTDLNRAQCEFLAD